MKKLITVLNAKALTTEEQKKVSGGVGHCYFYEGTGGSLYPTYRVCKANEPDAACSAVYVC